MSKLLHKFDVTIVGVDIMHLFITVTITASLGW